jgi:hypothetical protein
VRRSCGRSWGTPRPTCAAPASTVTAACRMAGARNLL